MESRPELQRPTRTLWEQLSTPDPAIRDFLKIPHDDEGRNADRTPCTLMDTVGRDRRGESDRRPCTIMDAISRDSRGIIDWKPRLGDRLRLRRDANALSTAISNRRDDEDGSEEEEEKSMAPVAASMSLMAMLEQADTQWDDDNEDDEDGVADRGSKCGTVADDEDRDGDGREEEEMVRACCVCTVRHKGAAFIPCGHTFCRICSREVLLARASCPLCNAFIHDILHIF